MSDNQQSVTLLYVETADYYEPYELYAICDSESTAQTLSDEWKSTQQYINDTYTQTIELNKPINRKLSDADN